MHQNYKISYEAQDPIMYNDLRLEGNISGKSFESATIALKHSLFVFCLYDEDILIGMGRVIGDGGAFFQVCDIVVKPSYQGQGLGKQIMREIMYYLEHHTYKGSY